MGSLTAIPFFEACVDDQFEDGRFACTKGGACPPGLVCASDGRCRLTDIDASTDGPPDAVDEDTSTVDAGACPAQRWTIDLDARAPSSLARADDGRLFATGVAGSAGWLAEIDPCDGGIVREQTFTLPNTKSTKFAQVAVASAEEVVVAGGVLAPDAATSTPVFGRFRADSLAKVSLIAAGTGVSAEATLTTVGKDGAQWIAGSNTAGAQGFIARVDSPLCTATLGSRPGGLAVATDGTVRVIREGTSATSEVFDTTCKAVTTDVPDPIVIGNGTVTPNGLTSTGDSLATLGTAQATNGTSFFVAQLSAPKTWSVVSIDPNPFDPDVGRGIVFDGASIFFAVSQRVVGSNGTPTIYRFDAPLGLSSKQVWSATPFGTRLLDVRAIAVDPTGSDGVYVAAASGSNGAISRCTKAGACP